MGVKLDKDLIYLIGYAEGLYSFMLPTLLTYHLIFAPSFFMTIFQGLFRGTLWQLIPAEKIPQQIIRVDHF